MNHESALDLLQCWIFYNNFSVWSSDKSMWKRRGRAAEHPSWRYFCRINRKSSNCKLCGVHVAYACSGNLMKHLKSRHLAEFAITQREWEEILKVIFKVIYFLVDGLRNSIMILWNTNEINILSLDSSLRQNPVILSFVRLLGKFYWK